MRLCHSCYGSGGVIDGRYKFEHGSWSLHNSATKCNQQLHLGQIQSLNAVYEYETNKVVRFSKS
jgi:hypothetical protein